DWLATISSSPRVSMMTATPTSGRKVTNDRRGQWLMPPLLLRQQIPGDQRDDADQHGKGVVIDVAGLQPAGLARQLAGGGGDPVGPEPIDDHAVTALPEAVAQGKGRAHEQPVVELVEVPFVEQEQVDRAEPRRQPDRNAGLQRIEEIGERDA